MMDSQKDPQTQQLQEGVKLIKKSRKKEIILLIILIILIGILATTIMFRESILSYLSG